MNLMSVVRGAFDKRNTSIAADLFGHVAEVIADGKVEPAEVVDAAAAVVGDALKEYARHDHPVVTVPLSMSDAASRADQAAEAIRSQLRLKLSDRVLTAQEIVDLVAHAAHEVLTAVAPEKKEEVEP